MIDTSSYNAVFNQLSSDLGAYFQPDENGNITAEQAQELFDIISWTPDLYFCTPEDGCIQRSELVKRLFDVLNIKCSLVMADKDIQQEVQGKSVDWFHHYAPAIQLSETFTTVVFDPLLAKEPLELDEWKQKLGLDNRNTIITSWVPQNADTSQILEILNGFKQQFAPKAA